MFGLFAYMSRVYRLIDQDILNLIVGNEIFIARIQNTLTEMIVMTMVPPAPCILHLR